ncbi:MAG: RluA family pseudouridine synthase [Patescibacteria group bacterium]|nr:RluA family pseudouridine synthase [Patescibacteria group bacterium]
MKKQHKFIVKEEDAGKRIDYVLAQKYSQYSRSLINKQIQAGEVIISSRSVKSSYKLKIGDKVNFNINIANEEIVPEKIELDVVFEDKDLLVINKPAGLVMHPAGKHQSGTLANALKSKLDTFYLVHRLDKDTSGLVLVAKNAKTKEYLTKLFADRKISKTYTALVKGRLTPSSSNLDLPIKREQGKFTIKEDGRSAQSKYEVIDYFPGYSLIDVCPKTGRTHQIRVHLSALDHPVAGDTLYGGRTEGLARQFLHAKSIEFTDWDKKIRKYTSNLPEDLNNFLQDVRNKK